MRLRSWPQKTPAWKLVFVSWDTILTGLTEHRGWHNKLIVISKTFRDGKGTSRISRTTRRVYRRTSHSSRRTWMPQRATINPRFSKASFLAQHPLRNLHQHLRKDPPSLGSLRSHLRTTQLSRMPPPLLPLPKGMIQEAIKEISHTRVTPVFP